MSPVDRIRLRNALAIAIAVALGSAIGVFLVDRGPWSRASTETSAPIDTAAAAKAAGATVAPTDPKTTLKPLEVPAAQPKPPA
jgi:hypothetical protein